QVKTVYIAFDADKAGQSALPKVKERLNDAHIRAYPVTLPYVNNLDNWPTNLKEFADNSDW
ncbi:toprim domain-containing protein, partial [candidate division TA06 bacterium]|nr:toprim domain-containing protein [candidate division TA06 bacterium]